jgi:hypothetical protein
MVQEFEKSIQSEPVELNNDHPQEISIKLFETMLI